MKKGFTLMELLFVVLVIVLVMSFAVPAVRSVRYDAKNSNAKAALRKLVEAQRTFYKDNKGLKPVGSFTASTVVAACENIPMLTGIPNQAHAGTVDATILFSCGYLNHKDFEGLPYTFYLCPVTGSLCTGTDYAIALPTSEAGSKYTANDYMMRIGSNMQVSDSLD